MKKKQKQKQKQPTLKKQFNFELWNSINWRLSFFFLLFPYGIPYGSSIHTTKIQK
jgi:hypothetical protein